MTISFIGAIIGRCMCYGYENPRNYKTIKMMKNNYNELNDKTWHLENV